jgi:Sap, sulfolipid-1-addressing protein
MWGAVLLLALVATADPVRIGIAILLFSRPRPVLQLFAFWLGGTAISLVVGLGVLFGLRDFALVLMRDVASTAASSAGGHVRIAIGVLALMIAALLTIRFTAFQRARGSMPGDDPSALVLQPSMPRAFSRLSTRAQDVLHGEALWVAFVVGAGMSTDFKYLVVLASILASGVAVGTQVGAAVVYTLVALAFVEIPLIGHLAAPAKTHVVLLQAHNWVRARRRWVVAVIVAVAGVSLVATGMGSV